MTADVVLHTSDLGKRFSRRWAVQDLSLEVRRGEVFGFLGPNGAGKSTTIRMLLSLITPTTGYVELFGQRLDRHRNIVLRRVGGLVERPDFYLYLSARRNLQAIAALLGGVGEGAIESVLGIVGLSDRANDRVKTFSHGMKQRLGIAQALLGNPEFIVLDEPTSGLDPQGIKEVRDLILKLAAERAITIFLSSHLLSEIEQTATSMAIVNRGQLVVQGRVQDLLSGTDGGVRMKVTPVDKASAMISAQPFVSGVKVDGGVMEVKVPKDKVSTLVALLTSSGLDVHAVIPRRSLEEYFLSITEGATDGDDGRRR